MPLPPSLDIRTLICLVTLLETRSVSVAAIKLGMTQPAVSRLLARLRDQLQDSLLVRGRSGMILSPHAEALLEPLKKWLGAGEALLTPKAFDPSTMSREFRIASTDFGVIAVLTDMLGALADEAPGVSLKVERLSRDSLRQLGDGQLDLVIIGYLEHENGVEFHHLFSEHHTGVMRADHPAADCHIDTDEFLKWPHVVPLIDGFGDPIHHALQHLSERRVTIAAPSFSLIPYLIEGNDAFAVLPSRAAQRFCDVHDLRSFQPPVKIPPFNYYVAQHDRSKEDVATQWLINRICEPFKDTQ